MHTYIEHGVALMRSMCLSCVVQAATGWDIDGDGLVGAAPTSLSAPSASAVPSAESSNTTSTEQQPARARTQWHSPLADKPEQGNGRGALGQNKLPMSWAAGRGSRRASREESAVEEGGEGRGVGRGQSWFQAGINMLEATTGPQPRGAHTHPLP